MSKITVDDLGAFLLGESGTVLRERAVNARISQATPEELLFAVLSELRDLNDTLKDIKNHGVSSIT